MLVTVTVSAPTKLIGMFLIQSKQHRLIVTHDQINIQYTAVTVDCVDNMEHSRLFLFESFKAF